MKSSTRNDLLGDLEAIEAQIAAANAALLECTNAISSFELDTGEADQRVVYKRLDTLQKTLDILRRQRDYINNRLCGRTVISTRVRRKPC